MSWKLSATTFVRLWTPLGKCHAVVEKPSVIIAPTIPGKGVDFMEYKYQWHGKPPKPEERAAHCINLAL